jgi:hypothetical protein
VSVDENHVGGLDSSPTGKKRVAGGVPSTDLVLSARVGDNSDRPPISVLKTFGQRRDRQPQGFRQNLDVPQRHVAFAALDPAHVSAVEPAPMGEGFLGEARPRAKLANTKSEPYQDVGLFMHA